MPSRAALLSAAFYLACSLVLYHGLLGGLASRAPGAGGGDSAQTAWFLAWVPHQVVHLHKPLITIAINYPTGANLMWNTAMPLAGVVMAPITLTLGPLASLNLLYILGPTLTAVTGRWWLCRHTTSEAGRFVGGLMVGFGFFITGHMGIHVNFELLPLVPVMLRLAEDVLWRARGRTRYLAAAGLGAVTGAQALLSEEIVALVVIGALFAALFAVLNAPRLVAPALARAIPAVALAAVVAGLLLLYPLHVQLRGPDRIQGVENARYYYAGLRDLLVPSSRFWFSPWTDDASLYSRGMNPAEDSVYVGLPLLLLLAAFAVWWWRRWEVRTAALTAAVALVIAFGSGLRPDGSHGWSRPGALLLHLPVLENVLPIRFGLVIQLVCGWALAIVVGAAVRALGRHPRARVGGIVALAGVALVVVSLLPTAPAQQTSARVPSYFTSDAVEKIPADSVVALLPAPGDGGTEAMLYAAMTGPRFKMIGSYARTFTNGGWQASFAIPDPISSLAATASARKGGISSITEDEIGTVWVGYAQLRIAAVIVATADDPDGLLAETARKVFGKPTQVTGGVKVWLVP